MTAAVRAHAKINLALVVGPVRPDGKHEVATLMQAIELHDIVRLEPAESLVVDGFAGDTIVRDSLLALAKAVGTDPRWRVRIDKRIPVASGLGGGSSDAAAALRLANAALGHPLRGTELSDLAARLGADIPFFLRGGTQLATADGTTLVAVDLSTSYAIVLALPHGAAKASTASVYGAFDRRSGAIGFADRRRKLLESLERVGSLEDIGALPANDLARADLADELRLLGAVRADVTGAGPCVYGVFASQSEATNAATMLAAAAETWVTRPVAAGSPI